MRFKHRLLSVLAVTCVTSLAGAQIAIDFESPTYTAGDISGQDGWVINSTSSTGTAIVVATDNGPSATGSQCLELISSTGNAIDIQRAIADAIATQGPLVTLQYDAKQTVGVGSPYFDTNVRVRLHDATTGSAAIAGGHWWQLRAPQYVASYTPDGTSGSWFDMGGIMIDDFQNTDWNTVKWTVYFGTDMGSSYGQLLSVETNGVVHDLHGAYATNWGTVADLVRVILYDSNPATLLVDNITITGIQLPSAAPVAEAGPDQLNIPATYDGGVVTLDGSGSTDDGSIVNYRWTLENGSYPSLVIADTPNPTVTTTLPVGQTHTVKLEVTDNTGLRHFDTCTIQIDSTIAPVPVDNLWGAGAIENYDIYGTSQQPDVTYPANNISLELINEKLGGAWDNPNPVDNAQFVFDRLGNIYYIPWYRTVKSLTPDLSDRWESENLGEQALEHSSIMVGERYVYVVGSGDSVGIPSVFAFSKSDGSTVWANYLDDGSNYEVWDVYWMNRPAAILYNDKIYVIGFPDENTGSVFIWQVSATDGNIDWTSSVTVGNLQARAGNCVLVPDFYGSGLHGLFFAGRSDLDTDGLSDTNSIQIDPATGATLAWGVDAGHSDFSRVIYSNATGRDALYVVAQPFWQSSQLWSFDANTGSRVPVSGMSNTSGNNFETAALGFDGQTVYVGTEYGHVHSYTDDGTGMSFDTNDVAYNTTAPAVGPRMISVEADNGDQLLVTTFSDPRYWWVSYEDASPSSIVVLNATQDQGDEATDEDLDDGAIYIDNVVVTYNGTPVFTENFESYNVGEFMPQATGVWTWSGDAGIEDTATIVVKDGSKVLSLNPFGGSDDYTSVMASLPQAYDDGVVEYSWDQFREDLTDNAWCGDYDGPAIWQWDDFGYGDPHACLRGSDPDYSPEAWPTAGVWQTCWIQVDFDFGYADMLIDGTNNGVLVYLGNDVNGDPIMEVDDIELGYQATPTTSSGWTPTLYEPIASYQISEVDIDNNRNYSHPVMLAVSPNGDIYQFQDGSTRRIQRLRVVSNGPTCQCADTNCDGAIDVFDIDPFVRALVDPAGYAVQYPNGDINAADTNKDGVIDVFDIDPFVNALVNGGCPN